MAGGAPKKIGSQKKSSQRIPVDSKHGSKDANKTMKKTARKSSK